MMKLLSSLLLLAVVSHGAALRAESPLVEWRGLFRAGDRALFSLHDSRTRESAWLVLGQTFAGFQLVEFDAANGVLTLERDHVRLPLQLATAQIKSAAPNRVLSREEARAALALLPNAEWSVRLAKPEEAARWGGDSTPRALTPTEAERLARSMDQAAPPNAKRGPFIAPDAYKPFGRDALPPEISANLTDEDIAEANAQMEAALRRQMGKIVEALEANLRAKPASR